MMYAIVKGMQVLVARLMTGLVGHAMQVLVDLVIQALVEQALAAQKYANSKGTSTSRQML